MGILDYFSSGAKKKKLNPKRKKRKMTYFSRKKDWEKKLDEADDYLEKDNAKED